jgi:hypothetical protein
MVHSGLQRLFFLPRIHAITIINFPYPDPPLGGYILWPPVSMSKVKALRLLNCNAISLDVASLLMWPSNIEEFHWDIDPDFAFREEESISLGLTPVRESLGP